jgi:hypothetical protein
MARPVARVDRIPRAAVLKVQFDTIRIIAKEDEREREREREREKESKKYKETYYLENQINKKKRKPKYLMPYMPACE